MKNIGSYPGPQSIVYKSRVMQGICNQIKIAASSKVHVLITGETGTGKELAGRAIHDLSSRKGRNFIPVNCAVVSDSLLGSELFGHKKGAYTSAVTDEAGKVEMAKGGTILFDEICELSIPNQGMLLRFISEDGESCRLGDNKLQHIDAKVIATTNRDIETEVKEERFREDLFYRLNVIWLHIPPLRERKEDVPLLLDFYLQKYRTEYQKDNVTGFSSDAREQLINYSYPGNVRELKNIVQKALFQKELAEVKSKLIESSYLPFNVKLGTFSLQDCSELGLKKAMENAEKGLLEKALRETGWNISRTALLLKVGRPYVHNKMLRYGIEKPFGARKYNRKKSPEAPQ
ncbi:MAG: sigma-54 dependent transcriptional regulator [bacterium]